MYSRTKAGKSNCAARAVWMILRKTRQNTSRSSKRLRRKTKSKLARLPHYRTQSSRHMKITSVAATFLLAVSLLFTASVRPADNPALMEPVKSVLDPYLAVQSELAKD